MVRILAPVLFVQTLAEESLMQAHELDLNRAQGASRTARMQQSTKAMEDQYKAMLESVVASGSWNDPKTGNPWVPDEASVLNPVQAVIEDMEEELHEQKDLNTYIMGNHSSDIVKCNSVRDASLAGVVTDLKNAMTAARGKHSSCRDLEDDAIDNMESACKKFDDLRKCGHEQDWFAAYKEGQSGPGTLQEAVDQAVTCKSRIASTTAKAVECDGAQDAFQASWCSYADELTDVCTTHQQCYDTNTDNWDQAQGTIDKLETEQKTIFRMLGRIRCYLKLLFKAAKQEKTPVQADIEACQATSVADDTLNVEYGSKADRGKCYDADAVASEPVTNRPGSSAWYDEEFSAYTSHNKLQPSTTCA